MTVGPVRTDTETAFMTQVGLAFMITASLTLVIVGYGPEPVQIGCVAVMVQC